MERSLKENSKPEFFTFYVEKLCHYQYYQRQLSALRTRISAPWKDYIFKLQNYYPL